MTDRAAAAMSYPPAEHRGAPAPRARSAAARRAPKRPSATAAVTGSLAVFLSCFSFLAWQLGTGHDPSLGSPVPPRQHKVIVKRIERKVLVTSVLPSGEGDDVAAAAGAPGGSVQVVQSSSSAPAAPVPAPTTQSS